MDFTNIYTKPHNLELVLRRLQLKRLPAYRRSQSRHVKDYASRKELPFWLGRSATQEAAGEVQHLAAESQCQRLKCYVYTDPKSSTTRKGILTCS